MADFKVKAAAIVVPVDGTERYLYRGALLPSGVKAADRKRLEDMGLVEQVEEVEVADASSEPPTTTPTATTTPKSTAKGSGAGSGGS